MFHLLSLALALLLLTSSASAQTHPILSTGSKVRITAPKFSDTPVLGKISYLKPDTLVLNPRRFLEQDIPLHAITLLEINLQQPLGQSLRSGAFKGALLASGYVAYAAKDACHRSLTSCNGEQVLKAVLGGAALGGLIGAIVGASNRDRWVPASHVPLRKRLPPAQIWRSSFR